MRVLLAGGVFRLSPEERQSIQPAPEMILARGLSELGASVTTVGLKGFREALTAQYDIVHVHHMSKMAVAMAIRSPRRLVFTHHASSYGGGLVRNVAETLVWRRSAALIALSHLEAAEKVRRFPFAKEKIYVVPNSVPPLGPKVVRRNIASDGEFTIAFVGKLNENKRPALAIQALTRTTENVVLEFTYHESKLEVELRQLAAGLGVAHRVRFLGRAQGAELADRYYHAHLLVLPSKFEALPSVVFEALMTGCPVVASDVGGVSEQVVDAGVLVPSSAVDLAEYINSAIRSYSDLSLAAFARGQALRRSHSVESMAEQHVRVYGSVMEAK